MRCDPPTLEASEAFINIFLPANLPVCVLACVGVGEAAHLAGELLHLKQLKKTKRKTILCCQAKRSRHRQSCSVRFV